MTNLFGEYALAGAMLTAITVLLACIGFIKTSNEGLLRFARIGQGLIALLIGVSSFGLVKALMTDDFSLAYVVSHSETALSPAYKAAAFWAGQEGSLLFWALLLSLMGVVMVIRSRKADTNETAIATATMAAVTGFFTAIMLFAGNPFERAAVHTHNGQGLNPMLQNWAMVLHPPTLFLGYAGFTAPFALMLGALLTGRKDSAWLKEARPWIVYSWITLTVGIVLGSWWAYMELGWGGYWAWDPVENASLLPWLTGTALLHSAILQIRRGIFKRWTASLVAASFFLCILGTYLTRSGIIQSVHSFGESPIGTFFLVSLMFIAAVSAGVILMRFDLLKGEHALDDLFSREGFFLFANVLLSLMTIVTLVGTIFPVISGWFSTTPVTVGPPFYNKVILPMAVLLAAMMATGPILGSGAGAAMRARVRLMILGGVGILAALVVALMGYLNPWSIAAAFTVAAIATGVVLDVIQSITARGEDASMFGAGLRTFTSRPRHWGAQLAHLGIAAIVAGITASSVYGHTENFELKAQGPDGQPTTGRLGQYTLSATGLEQVRRENHTSITARIKVQPDSGEAFFVSPERRFYDQAMRDGQSYAEVGLRFSLASDLYVTLAGWEENGSVVTISAILNPLVSWIWIGGGLLTLGGLVCLIPTGSRQTVPAASPAVEPAPAAPLNAGHTARERRRARQLQPATPVRN